MSRSALPRRLQQLTLSSSSASPLASSSRCISTSSSLAAEAQPQRQQRSSPPGGSSSSGRSSSGAARRPGGGGGGGGPRRRRTTRDGENEDEGGNGRDGRSSSSTGGGSGGRVRQITLPAFDEWIKKAGTTPLGSGTGRGPHWIADTPFPLNPSFNPPAPVAQRRRDAMWDLHAQDPTKHSVRALSRTFGLPMERIQAILRLKALEQEMKQRSIPLQTEFQANMERLLGSATDITFLKGIHTYRPAEGSSASASDGPPQVPAHQVEAQSVAPKAGLAALEARGPLFEEDRSLDGSSSSPLAAGLQEEHRANVARMQKLPTGAADQDVLREAKKGLAKPSAVDLSKGEKVEQPPAADIDGRGQEVQGQPDSPVPESYQTAATPTASPPAAEAPAVTSRRATLQIVDLGKTKGGSEVSYKGVGSWMQNKKRQERKHNVTGKGKKGKAQAQAPQ